MTGQNDRQDRSLTGQVRNQAGHCPLTGRYLQPWIYEKFSSSTINLGVAQLMNIILKDRKCLDYKSHEYFEEKTRKLLLLTKN